MFLACNSIYAERAICYRLSVCLSHGVDQSKMVDVRIIQLSPQSSLIPVVFAV